MSEKTIASTLFDELNNNFGQYQPFTCDSRDQFFAQLSRFLHNKIYNCNATDLLPTVAANAFDVNIIIIQNRLTNLDNCTKIIPFKSSPDALDTLLYIILHLRNKHYNATKLASSMSTANSTEDDSRPTILTDVSKATSSAAPRPTRLECQHSKLGNCQTNDGAYAACSSEI